MSSKTYSWKWQATLNLVYSTVFEWLVVNSVAGIQNTQKICVHVHVCSPSYAISSSRLCCAMVKSYREWQALQS